jgi:hypothetical protein
LSENAIGGRANADPDDGGESLALRWRLIHKLCSADFRICNVMLASQVDIWGCGIDADQEEEEAKTAYLGGFLPYVMPLFSFGFENQAYCSLTVRMNTNSIPSSS